MRLIGLAVWPGVYNIFMGICSSSFHPNPSESLNAAQSIGLKDIL